MLSNLDYKSYINDPSCSECVCYRFNIVLFKMYYAKEDAQQALEWNTLAFQNQIGPHPSTKIYKAGLYWGYFVEEVPVLKNCCQEIINTYYESEIQRSLEKKFKLVFGFEYRDIHNENLGIIGDRLVFIDFGPLIHPKTSWKHYDEKMFHFREY